MGTLEAVEYEEYEEAWVSVRRCSYVGEDERRKEMSATGNGLLFRFNNEQFLGCTSAAARKQVPHYLT
jgi:hypothetical protein